MALRVRLSTLVGCVLLILWGILLSVGVMLYVQYGSAQQLAAAIAREVSSQTGLPCRIGGASPGFLPSPRVSFTDFLIELPHGYLDVAEASASISWKSLLRARFVPGRLELEKPVLVLDMTRAAKTPQSPAPEAPNSSWPILPEDLRNLRLSIRDGQASLKDSRGALTVAACSGTVRLPGRRPVTASLTADAIRLELPGLTPVGMESVRLNLRGPESQLAAERLELAARVSMAGLTPGTDVALLLQAGTGDAVYSGSVTLRGELAATPPIPLDLQLPFAAYTTDDIRIDQASVQLDQDSGTLSGALALGPWGAALADLLPHEPGKEPRALPSLSGTATVRQLSLPRWFDFARRLPAGIETALNALSGDLDFTLTPQTLTVPRLSALLCGIPFQGSGGVPDFSKPEIRIAAQAKTADANKVFPELVRKAPPALTWAGPAPVGGNDAEEGPDYDIHLTAAEIKAWKFTARDFGLRITPRPSGSRLSISAGNFYAGKLESVVDIEDTITLSTQVRDVLAETPLELASGLKSLRGKLDGKSSFTGSDVSFDHFLASLSGTLEGVIRDGSLGSADDPLPFETLSFSGACAGPGLSKPPLPPELPFAGTWNLRLKTADWEAGARLKGEAVLDSDSLALRRFRELPGRLDWSGWGVRTELDARVSFDLQAQTLDILSASGSINGGKLSGALSGTALFDAPSWNGRFTLTTTALERLLAGRGLLPQGLPQGTLQSLEAGGEFAVNQETLSLSKLKGRLDDTLFSGSVRRTAAPSARWNVNLGLGTLNLSRYLPQTRDSQKQADWPVDLLQGLTADGVITLDNLIVSKVAQRSMKIPFSIGDNTLRCAPVTFVPYNGQGEAELTVQGTPQGYRSRLQYAVRQADAALFCREAGFNTILGGTAALKADLAGILRRGRDIPAALDGNWSIAATRGFLAERRKDGTLSDRTPFHSISASGIMQKGVLKTDDIDLRSDSLAAKGRATVNLVNWTLNCRLNVSSRTFSNVPVTYTGSLDAPVRQVDALNAVTGTLSKIGSGVFGLVQDVLSAPFRLFQR